MDFFQGYRSSSYKYLFSKRHLVSLFVQYAQQCPSVFMTMGPMTIEVLGLGLGLGLNMVWLD